MRPPKIAIAAALAEAVKDLVSKDQVYSVERATLPVLPAIELVAVASEPQESGPMIKHSMSIEITVSHVSEDGADEALDSIVAAVRRRLLAAATGEVPIVLPDDSLAVVELQGTRWSISAGGPSSVLRGAAISLSVGADE